MPTYVAFLRAINLGPARQFPKDAIVAAVASMGGTDIETYINTGNVRLTTPMRSRVKIEQTLEETFAADRGFEVPTMVYALSELVALADEVDRLAAGLIEGAMQYVSVLKADPPAQAALAFEALEYDGERAWVRGRAVHVALDRPNSYHAAQLNNALVERLLGPATNRKATVIRELAARWGGRRTDT